MEDKVIKIRLKACFTRQAYRSGQHQAKSCLTPPAIQHCSTTIIPLFLTTFL